MSYEENQIAKLYGPVLARLSDNLENGEAQKILDLLSTVTENVYYGLPSGDYGRGDVKRTIRVLCDEYLQENT